MSYLNPNTVLGQFGAPNYIQNSNFEGLDTFSAQVTGAVKWNAYKDAAGTSPVDGTGGSPTVINNAILASGSQIRGTRSWQLSKTGNAQGEGYSQDFIIDAADKSQALTLTFDYNAGSAYTAGDLAVFLYDITNATLITPTLSALPAGAGTFQVQWASTTSTSYRLIFHCAATNVTTTNWSMILDNIQVSKKDQITGPAVGDWQNFTPVIVGLGSGSTSFSQGKWRRIGDSIELNVKWQKDATPGSGATWVYFVLPNNLQLDLTKIPDSSAEFMCGIWRQTTGSYFTGNVFMAPYLNTTNIYATPNGSSVPVVGAGLPANLISEYQCLIPISNWSSNITLANNQTEWAFNTNTANSNDSTSFGYGPGGVNFGSFTISISKRIRFTNPIQPSDVIQLEVFSDNHWIPLTTQVIRSDSVVIAEPYQIQNTNQYGIALQLVPGSTTDVDVNFGTYRVASGATYGAAGGVWSSVTSNSWRVRKSTGPNALQLSGTILGVNNGSNAVAGYVGEYKESTITSSTAFATSAQYGDITFLSLDPGDWDVSLLAWFDSNGATVTNWAAGIGTATGNNSTGLVSGVNYVDASGPNSSGRSHVSIPVFRVNISSTTTYYAKEFGTYIGAIPQFRGRLSARRIR